MDAPVIDAQTPTLSEVTPSALGALGVSGFVDDLGFGARTSICVLLVDGLGWELLDAHAADAPVLAELWKRPLRVGYPATTAAGLAAIGTGVPPGEHGMVGYSFEVPEVGVLNVLRWRRHPDGEYLYDVVSPEEVQTRPTLFAVAAEAGVATTVVSEAQFEGTPLTRAVLSGGTYVGVHALGDLAAAVSTALRERRGFCYAYHGDLDFIGHLYGPGSVPWRLQLRQVDRLVESLVENLPRGAALAVVADHGMVVLDETTVVDVDAEPDLRAGVRALAGEVRARHVYAADGASDDVFAAWRETLGDRAWVMRRQEAVERGWFGPVVAEHVLPRIGDIVVAARGRSGVLRRRQEPRESRLIGQHGSLTRAEQLVPFALAVRD
ncbi:alkaline phosphatase family protein [Saccharomonospora viridis]|uniref:alkaline phosphatase family protein n=1 Tax=Saccharomonospora viridis TaxID=1852 RepID=UPI00056878AD|nr:nucleotide pyrophosphatase/phosphodiesterase family protein [Saccharomonospora viridis]SFP40454.1 Type I phosphodiesterase / nucleotide pyrophosphatase [Saccharomonospora viridis]